MSLEAFESFTTAMLVLVGAVVGSFLNVVVWRLPRGESIVHPGSHCPHCGSPIRSTDNVPVLGWLLLAGKCRCCRGPISARYPIVEAACAGLTWIFVAHDGFTPLLAFHLAFAWGGLALALIDLDTFLLPFALTLPLIPIAIASGWFAGDRGLLRSALGAGMGWALIVIVGKVGELVAGQEAMGGGDAWLMASIGGFTGPLKLFVALFFASVQGAILGYALLVSRRRAAARLPAPAVDDDTWVPPETAVPFGPFLVLGAFEAILWGDRVLAALNLDQLGLWG